MVLAEESPFGIPGAVEHSTLPRCRQALTKPRNCLVLAPHDDEGLVEDLVHLPVAELGQVVGTAHDLPHPHPDRFPLPLLRIRRDV